MFLLTLAIIVKLGWVAATNSLPAPLVEKNVIACFWESYLYPNFTSEDIEANLCNHIVYGTAKLNATTWELTHDNVTIDIDLEGFKNISDMKKLDPNLKVEIGAWSLQNRAWETPREYYEMISSETHRKTFVESVVTFVTENNFDGFHLQWGNPKCSEVDLDKKKHNLTDLVGELRASLHRKNKTLSLSMWALLSTNIDRNFETEKIYKQADLVFINAFHYFGNWFQKTGGFAPIYPGNSSLPYQRPDDQYLNVDESWQHLMRRKASPRKTVLVISPKGSGFKLKNVSDTGFEAPSFELDAPSIGDQPKFNEICSLKGWVKGWDEDRKIPFMYKGDEWASYEDENSVEAKVDYANKQGFAGVAINNLYYDDFAGRCDQSNKFPLLRLINKKLKGKVLKNAGIVLHVYSSLLPLLLLTILRVIIT